MLEQSYKHKKIKKNFFCNIQINLQNSPIFSLKKNNFCHFVKNRAIQHSHELFTPSKKANFKQKFHFYKELSYGSYRLGTCPR